MNDDPRYQPVTALREHWPPLTASQALWAYNRLKRHFGLMADEVGPSGRRSASPRTKARRCWIARQSTLGHFKGWGRLIHDCSHTVFRNRFPKAAPHAAGHARLEREMVQYVLDKNWLELCKPAPKPTRKRKTYAERIAHTNALMARWETKAKRAATALRKLKRRVRALERAAKTVTPDTLVSS